MTKYLYYDAFIIDVDGVHSTYTNQGGQGESIL